MKIDAVNSGTMIEIGWQQRMLGYRGSSLRTVKMVLLNPVLSNIGTINQRLAGWNCQVIYDSHEKRKEIPYNKYYEVKWLKLCERQGNFKIISQAHMKDETNK